MLNVSNTNEFAYKMVIIGTESRCSLLKMLHGGTVCMDGIHHIDRLKQSILALNKLAAQFEACPILIVAAAFFVMLLSL